MEGSKKYLAIQFYGHVRTYQKTYKSFFEHIVNPNMNDGYEVHIFIHTWDKFTQDVLGVPSVNQKFLLYPTLGDKPLEDEHKQEILKIYEPKAYQIERLDDISVTGQVVSLNKVRQLRDEYAKKQGIVYDYILTTRMDILFYVPLRVDFYVGLYKDHPELKRFPLPSAFAFCGTMAFSRGVLDARYPNEATLVFFSNIDIGVDVYYNNPNILKIFMRYRHGFEFIILREVEQHHYPLVEISRDKIGSIPLMSAKNRVYNHLAYKLGKVIVDNSQSLWGYIRMPYILSYVKEKHYKEKEEYHKAIQNDPSQRLPIVEMASDYEDAMKIKKYLTYKLGEELIAASKAGGGHHYLLFILRAFALKKEYKALKEAKNE